MKLQVSLNPSWTRELAPGDRRLWLLRAVALRIEIRADPLWVVEIFWKRLLAAGAVLAIVAYLAAATAAWWWWDRTPRNQVRWRDVALAPVYWDELTRRRGETAIATALERLKQHDYTEAYYGLRVGLARAPGDAHGRVVLAGMLAGQNPLQAVTLLEEGLQHSPNDLELLKFLFGLYAAQEAPGRARQQAELLMAPGRNSSTTASTRFFLGSIRYGLLLNAGQWAEAERVHTELEPLIATEAERQIWARLKIDLLLKRQQVAEASAWYRQKIQGKDRGPEALRLSAEIALAAGDMEELSHSLHQLHLSAADSITAYLYEYQCWQRAKQPTRRLEAERTFFTLYGGNDAALQALAALAVNLGQPDTVNRAMQSAREHRLSNFAFQVHLTELALREGKSEAAFRQLQGWERALDTLKPEQRFYPLFLSRLVHCTSAGGGQQVSLLLNTLANGYGQARMGVYRLATEVLERSGNAAAAAQVAQAGLVRYPYSEPLLAAQERLQPMVAAQSPGTPIPVPAVSIPVPANASAALAALDRFAEGGEYLRGHELLQEIRRQAPDWLTEHEAELSRREVRLALCSGDLLAARAVLTGYLIKHRDESEVLPLVELAAEELAGKREAEARLVHDTVAAQPGLSASVQQALTALHLADDLAALAADAPTALAALDQSLARRDLARADGLLRQLRDKPPAWWDEAAADIAVREVPLRLALDQQPLALESFKSLVIHAGAPRSAAFKLVRDLAARGEREWALLLARETVRLRPDDPAAAKLLREIESPEGK